MTTKLSKKYRQLTRKTYRERRVALARLLQNLPQSWFDIGTYEVPDECGSATCALGWCPKVFPKQWVNVDHPKLIHSRSVEVYGDAAQFFGLSDEDSVATFASTGYGIRGKVTAKMVAERLLASDYLGDDK